MLKRGQIIRVPKDADLVMLREMKKQGLGNVFGIRGGSEFMILQTLVGRAGIEQGDYMAVRPGWTTFYLIPKAMAEGWDLEVDPAQEDERRTLDALQAELDKAQAEIVRLHALVGAEQARAEAYDAQNLEIVRALEEAGQLRAGKDPVGAVRELSLTIAAEQGRAEGAPFSSSPRLRAAVNAERIRQGLSWRGLAARIGVSSSGFTRWNAGHELSVPAYLKVCDWLRSAMLAADAAATRVQEKP